MNFTGGKENLEVTVAISGSTFNGRLLEVHLAKLRWEKRCTRKQESYPAKGDQFRKEESR